MDYSNPNDLWINEHDPYKDMNDDERMTAGCAHCVLTFLIMIAVIALCALFGSCSTTEYVPVVETHDHHHWHTDSIRQTDSVYHETTTTIMQLDSAAMAKYGIQLKAAERAWLVRTQELERQLQQMARLMQDRDTVRDSIPIPYPVEVTKEVPAPLTWWQQTRLHVMNIILYICGLALLLWILKSKLKWL